MPVILPLSLDEAIAARAAHPDAMVLAGGTDAMVEINAGHLRIGPADSATVIAVDRVAELRTWTIDQPHQAIDIGAAVTYAELMAEPLASLVPALAQASRTVGSPQIRNAGTLGGNLGTCSPAGDGLPVLAALDATVCLASATGMRQLPVGEFMVGVKRTALQPGELIASIRVPILEGWQGYAKVGVRNAMVIAIASAALVMDRSSRSVRIALGSVGPTVLRCPQAEHHVSEMIDWDAGTLDDATVERFGQLVAATSQPIDDHRATAAYRRRAVEVLARRLVQRAFAAEQTR